MDGIKVIKINLNKERNEVVDSVRIIPISDQHIGDPLLDKKLLRDTILEIKNDPNCYAIINGDVLNTGIKNSKTDSYKETMTVGEQIDTAIEYFEPISKKILVYHGGNHERRVLKETGIDISKVIAQRLDIEDRYSENMWYLFLQFGKSRKGYGVIYNIGGYHGSAGGRKSGGKINRLVEMSDIFIADLYIMGHGHKAIITDGSIFIPDSRHQTLKEKELNYMMTNSFLKYGGYGAVGGYIPNSRSTSEVILDGHVKKLTLLKKGREL